MKETLPDDPWHRYYDVPDWLKAADRAGRARPEDAARRLPEGRQGHPGARPRRRRTTGSPSGEADDGGGRDPEEQGCRASASQQLRASEHPQAQFLWAIFRDMLALLRRASGRDRRQRARPRSRDPLGLRLEPGAVRDLAGGGLAARWRSGSRRTSRPARAMAAVPLPAWVAGDRRAPACTRRRARTAPAREPYKPRSTLPVYRRQPFPGPAAGRGGEYGATIFETDARALLAHRRRHRDRQLQEQDARDRRRRARRRACRRSTRPSATSWAWSSGRPSRRSRSARTCKKTPAGRREADASRPPSAGCSSSSGARRSRWC